MSGIHHMLLSGGRKYNSFTVVYLGNHLFSSGVPLTGIDFGYPQPDRQLVGVVSSTNRTASNYTLQASSDSLTRVVSRNGLVESSPGVALFLGSGALSQSTGTLTVGGNGENGVVGLYAVYKAATSAAGTGSGSSSYTVSSGDGAIFAGVGVRNAASSIEKRGAGGHALVSAGTHTVEFTTSSTTALYGDVNQDYNTFIGGTGDSNGPVSAAFTLNAL